jgi:Domain of unknown function (DUF4190)/zinc-ribbon domain
MFCFKCGSAIADDSKSCSSCGTPVPVMTGVAAAGIAPPPPPAQGNFQAASTLPTVAAPQFVPALPQTDDKALISLVLGVLSLISFSILAGIPAIILGKMSRENIRASSGRLTGEGMATAGRVMGWVSVGLAGVFLLIILLIVIFAIAAGTHY